MEDLRGATADKSEDGSGIGGRGKGRIGGVSGSRCQVPGFRFQVPGPSQDQGRSAQPHTTRSEFRVKGNVKGAEAGIGDPLDTLRPGAAALGAGGRGRAVSGDWRRRHWVFPNNHSPLEKLHYQVATINLNLNRISFNIFLMLNYHLMIT